MTAATSPTIFFSSKGVSLQSTRQPVSLGRYRILGRQAHALLSDGGIVLPSSTPSTSAFPQNASAASKTSLITEGNTSRHRSSSDDLFTAGQDAHSHARIVEDVRASDSGYDHDRSASHRKTQAIVSMPSPAQLPSDNNLLESHKSSTFLRSMKTRIRGSKFSNSDTRSTDASHNDVFLDPEETHAQYRASVYEQNKRNSHEQQSHSPSSRTNDISHAIAMNESMALQESSPAKSSVGSFRRGKQTIRSQSVARESAVTQTPKHRSLSVIEVESLARTNDDTNRDRLTAQTGYDILEELASPKQVSPAQGGVHKSRSKFLTELYSGAEKIKRFINREKIKKDNKMSSVLIATQPSEIQDARSHSGDIFTLEHQNQCKDPRKSIGNIDTLLGNSPKEGSPLDEAIIRSAHSDTDFKPVSNNSALPQLETVESFEHAQDRSKQSLLPDYGSGVCVSDTAFEQTNQQYIDTPRQSIADASIPKLKLQHEYAFEATLARSKGEPQWKVQETQTADNRGRLSLPDTKPASEHEVTLSTNPGRDTPRLSVTPRPSIDRQRPGNQRVLSDVVAEAQVSTVIVDARKRADNAVRKIDPATANNSNHTEKNITLQNEPRDGSQNNRSSTLRPSMIKYTFEKDDPSQGQSAGDSRQSEILNAVSQVRLREMTGVNNKQKTTEKYVLNTGGSVSGNCLERDVGAAAAAGCTNRLCPVSPGVTEPSSISYSNTDNCQQLTASHDAMERSLTQARINGLKTQFHSYHESADPTAGENLPLTQAPDPDTPCPEASLSVGAGSSKYEAIGSLPELHRLLSEAQDPAERRAIRGVIRRLRYRPESVPFGIELKLHPAQFRSSTSQASQTEQFSSPKNEDQGSSALKTSTLLHSSPALSPSTGSSSLSPSAHGQNTVDTQFSQSESTSHKSLIGDDRQLNSFDLNRDSKFTDHPVILTSINVLDTKTSGHPEVTSPATPASESYSSPPTCDGPRRRPTEDTAGSLADQVEEVSSVIKYVKARLNSRSESLASQSKHSSVASVFDQASLPPVPGQISKVKSGLTVHAAGDNPDKIRIPNSAGPSPIKVLGRSSDNALEKYKEARNKILRSSNIKDLSIKANDNYTNIKPFSRPYVGSNPLLSASQATLALNVVSACAQPLTDSEISADAQECSDVRENVTKDQKRVEIDHNPEPHDRVQRTLTSSLRQHYVSPEAEEISETDKSVKQCSSSFIFQIPSGAASSVSLERRAPDTLNDVQKQERGERLPASTALASSLSGDQDQRLESSNLKRSQSLNLKVVNCSHSDSDKGKSPLQATAVSSSCAQLEVDYRSTVIRDDQSVDCESDTSQPRKLTNLADSFAAQTTIVKQNRIRGNSEFKGSSVFAGMISPDLERTTMQSKSKSTIKRSKPVGRSLTESHISRPRVYTSHLEVQMMPKITDTADSKCIVLNEPIQWTVGNIADRSLVDSVKKYSDSTIEPTNRSIHASHSFLSRSQVQMSDVDTAVQPITVQRVQAKDQTDNAFKQNSPIDTDVNCASLVGSTSRQVQMQRETASPAPQPHDWNVCSRQPASTMEKAFSMLLEGLDMNSGSEGNPSDLDISDGEDWVTITSASGSPTGSSTVQQSSRHEPEDVSEHPARVEDGAVMAALSDQISDSDPVNADQSGPASVSGAAISVVTRESNREVTLPPQRSLRGMSAQEGDVRSQSMMSSLALSPSLCQSDMSTSDATTDATSDATGSAGLPQDTAILQEAGDTGASQEQSGDRMMRQVFDIMEDKTHDASVDNLTTHEIIQSHNNNNITNGSQTSKAIPETAETISSHRYAHLSSCRTTDTNMAAEGIMRSASPLDNIDNFLGSGTVDAENNDQLIRMQVTTTSMADEDTPDSINNNIVGSTSARIDQPQDDIDNFLGTGVIDVSQNDDGTITVQAVAEDRSQNKTVTVRTKTHRTPSNANEELRDTIVERKTHSPGGAVLVERDVIQTKNRLTSRGSNYYSRSAYTLRTRREQGGAETVEHSVCVESENKSVSQGHSWGDKAVAQVTFVDASCAASVAQLPGSSTDEVPRSSAEGMRDHHHSQLDIQPCQSRDKHSNGVADMRATQHTTDPAVGQGQGPPTFEKRLIDVSVTEGHSTILSCTVTGAVSLEWYQNGVLKRNSADFKQFYDGREARLQIGEVFLGDAGQYTCIAKNNVGEQRSSCHLHVVACDQETVVVPMFLTKLTSREVIEGQMLILECDVIGSPEPIITWLKDGRQLDGSLSYGTSYDGRVASLQISTMRFQDTGCYMCVAENPAGRVSIDAIVTVQVKHQGPHFVSKLENKSAASGDGIVLQCEITGYPLPFVSWRKDGRLIHTSSNCVQSFHNKVARLEIIRASAQDSACYECVAKNPVSEIACQCHVQVVQQTKYHLQETTAPREEQIIPSVPKLTKNRIVKKLCEPRPADIIAAVIQRASSQGVQRAQSFTPGSSTISRERFMVAHAMEDKSSNSQLHNVHSSVNQPQTVSVVRNTITMPPRSNIHTESTITSLPGNDLHTNPDVKTEKHYGISRTPSLTISEPAPYPGSTSLRVTNLGRSSSMNMGSSNNQAPHGHNIQSSGSVKSLWTAPSKDQLVPRETITKSFSQEVVSDLRPASPIVGYRSVLATSLDKDRPAQTTSRKYLSSSSSNISNSHTEPVLTEQSAHKYSNYVPSSSNPTHPSTRSYISETMEPYSISASPSSTSAYSVPSSRVAQKSPAQGISQLLQEAPETKVQVPSVSALRQHFLKNDQVVATSLSNSSTRNTAGGVRRWESLPLQASKPIVFQRKSTSGAPRLPTMPSYDNINDEEELHKLMNATDDFEERKKIRARIREIREKQREESEAKRRQREAEAEDLVKAKFKRAEEEKRKKMEAYKQQAPTHERDSKYHEVSQNLIQEKYKAAEEEKARKLAAYNTLATTTKILPGGSETTIAVSTTTEKTPGGGVRTVTQKTSETKGFGGTSYGKPAEVTARELTERLMRASGPGIIGHVTVRTEAWNSTNGLVEKSEKSHSWGAKPQGPKSAMAAFKQLDTTNNPDSAVKPKGLVRSPTAIKQILLDWAKAMTQGYPGVEVTNFSTSWNNGMAFCALIHHFFPNAFDFAKLDPKQRRYNFTLAFDTAEKEADIAPLLDVEDMVKMKTPDWKCVFTYVQSIYRHLKDHENNKAGPIEQ